MVATLDEFTRAYIECALWSSMDESDDRGGNPMDENYSADDLAPETLEKIIADCEKFQRENGHDIATGCTNTCKGCSDLEYAGHDFWLTRVGHGTGFWDGDWTEEAGERLTAASKQFGEVNLYVGDDGLLYLA